MKLLGGRIHMETSDLIQAGVAIGTLKSATLRGTLKFIKDPADGRASLFPFDELPARYAALVEAKYGDPMEHYAGNAIRAMVTNQYRLMAGDFYRKFKFADGTGLPDPHIYMYTEAAAWLTMLASTKPSATGYATAADWWDAVCRIIKTDGIDLPSSYSRLRKVMKKFGKGEYASLISGKFGNANGEKLGAVQKAYIRELYANRGQAQVYLPTQVHIMYTAKAQAEGWPLVTDKCILDYINTPEVQVLCAKDRYGKKELLNIIPVINRSRPSAPNVMWGIDGSPFELAYRDEDGKVKRPYVFMVVDYYSNKWLGMSISETETGEAVMSAVKQACTLHNVLPHQIQGDHGSAIMRCKEQLEAIATFTPAKVGWARSKPIEAVLGHINSTILKWYPNHSGANITAKSKDRKINPDEAVNNLPTKAEAIRMVYEARALWNSRPNGKGMTPDELHGHASPMHRPLAMEDRIRLFGVPRRKPVTYTNQGITLSIGGEDVKYLVPDADFYVSNYGRKFTVRLDPDDLSMIGLFDAQDGRFIEWAYEKALVPMAELDHTEDTKREMGRQMRLQREVEQRMEEDAEARATLLDAETTAKLPTGVNGRFKDHLNDAHHQLKVLELVGVVPPAPAQRPKRSIYDRTDADTARILE